MGSISGNTLKGVLARLRELRKELAIRQEYLAGHLGVDRSTYVRKERGVIPITTDEWLKLAAAMRRDPAYFFSPGPAAAASERDLNGKERLLVRFYRALRPPEQDELMLTIAMKYKNIRRKAVRDTLRLMKGCC